MIIRFVFCVLLWSMGVSSYSKDNSSFNSKLVFSEMTIDSPPGDDNSWIELYNKSDVRIKLDGYTIVCNNQKVFTFPSNNYYAYPKAIIIINFSNLVKTIHIDQYEKEKITVPICSNQVKTDPSKILRKSGIAKICKIIKQRSPGYCALFKSQKLNKANMIDYIQWGRDNYLCLFPYKISKTHYTWAKELGIWESFDGIAIGIDPFAGDVCCTIDYIALQRKLFTVSENKKRTWRIETLKESTPGKGNLWFPPNSLFLVSTDYRLGANLKINAWEYNDFRLRIKTRKIRLQVAKDPHFEGIIYDKLIAPKATIKDYDFKIGIYFARIRIESDNIFTNWSKPSSFSYEKPNSAK